MEIRWLIAKFSVRFLIAKFQQTFIRLFSSVYVFSDEIGGASSTIVYENEVKDKPFHTETSGKEMENKCFTFKKFRKIIDTE